MGWHTTADLERFATAAGGYLRARAAENTQLLSAAHADPNAAVPNAAVPNAAVPNGVGPLFGWWEPPDGGGPRGAFLHDPRVPLLIAGRVPEMAAALAALLAKTGRPVCGVDAPVEAADAFAAAWRQRSGTAVRMYRSLRVYRLVPAGAEAGGSPGSAGRLRAANSADRPLLAEWLAAFATEAGDRIGSPHDLAAELIGYGGAVFWEVPRRGSRLRDAAQFLASPRHRDAPHRDAPHRDTHHQDTQPHQDAAYQPVAMAALTRPVAGTVRVSMVYTPPEHRGNGYAAAVTFAASRAALDGPAPALGGLPPGGLPPGGPTPDGADAVTEVVLITDGSGPDRRVGQLGYQLVDERAVFRFGPPTGPLPRLKSATGPMPRLPTGPLPRLRH